MIKQLSQEPNNTNQAVTTTISVKLSESSTASVQLAPCLRCVRSHLVSQRARNAPKCSRLFVYNWDQSSTKNSKTDISRFATFLGKCVTVCWLRNTRLNVITVNLQRALDTHWHVGEEIAAAEKEALPEARGSYRWFL